MFIAILLGFRSIHSSRGSVMFISVLQVNAEANGVISKLWNRSGIKSLHGSFFDKLEQFMAAGT